MHEVLLQLEWKTSWGHRKIDKTYTIVHPFLSLLSNTSFLPLRISLGDEMLTKMFTQILNDRATLSQHKGLLAPRHLNRDGRRFS
jgi:hypothetical protein